MSEFHDNMLSIVQDRAPGTTDPVLNITSGKRFTAEIDGTPDALLIATELGEDAREVILFHVTSDTEAMAISKNDVVQFRLFGVVSKARIIKRRNSPASVQADFWAAYIVPGKDA